MSDEMLDVPELLKREKDKALGNRIHRPARYEQKLIRVRDDGTKVYMFQIVEEAHYINEDGSKTYEGANKKTEWVMSKFVPKVKRRDIHTTIDKEIFKAIDNLKYAKKRLVIAEVRRVMLLDDNIVDKLPKNLGTSISRRIGHLVDKRNLAYEQQTKARRVLVKGKYRYVG
jgi:hypothetical protein